MTATENQRNCKHPLTVKYSTTMNFDRCLPCQGILVWCDVTHPPKTATNPQGDPDKRHYHLAGDVDEAVQFYKSIKAITEGGL